MTVEQLRQLEQSATPGPWEADLEMDEERPSIYSGVIRRGPGYISFQTHVAELDSFERDGDEDEAQALARRDAELIAAMRNAFPALLDIAKAAQAVARYAPSNTAASVEVDAFAIIDLMAALSRLEEATDVD